MATTDRRAFNLATSQHVQGDLAGIIGRLEKEIAKRSTDVAAAMADFQADHVADDYRAVEDRWNRAADEVRSIIALLKTTLAKNDESATNALSMARSAVQGIG